MKKNPIRIMPFGKRSLTREDRVKKDTYGWNRICLESWSESNNPQQQDSNFKHPCVIFFSVFSIIRKKYTPGNLKKKTTDFHNDSPDYTKCVHNTTPLRCVDFSVYSEKFFRWKNEVDGLNVGPDK